MKEHFVQREDISLCTEGFGNPQQPAILLMMGATASMLWWDEKFCEQLSNKGFFVIRYDNRDVGQSTTYPPGPPPYELEDLVDDAIGILDAYAIKRAHLFGMSLGGLLCQVAALKYPDRVLSLVLMATGPFGPSDPSIPSMDERIINFQTEATQIDWSNENAVVSYLVRGGQLLSGSGRPYDVEHAKALLSAEFRRASNFRSMFNHAQLQGADTYFGKIDLIKQPSLIIHGTDDHIWNYKHALVLENKLPNAALTTLEGAGHELHQADWNRIIAAVARHIELIE